MKDNQQVQPIIGSNTITFNIADGGDALVLDMEKLHPDIIRRAAMVGMAQVRIVDAAAISATDKEGNIRGRAERIRLKREAMEELIAHYHTGTSEWSRVGTGGGGKSLTIEAIAELRDITYDDAVAMIKRSADAKFAGDTKKCLATLRGSSDVQKKMADIRDRRAGPSKVDADSLLEEME